MNNISFCIVLNFSQERWLAQVLPFDGELPLWRLHLREVFHNSAGIWHGKVHNWPYFGRSYAGASVKLCSAILCKLLSHPASSWVQATNFACKNCAIHLHNSSRFVDAFLNWRSALDLECDSGGDESGQSVFHPYPRPQQLAQVWQTAEKLIWSHHSLWGSSWGGHGWATDLFRWTRLVWSPRLAEVHDSFLLKEGQSKPIG